MRFVRHDGGGISIRSRFVEPEAPMGRPIVLVHGLGVSGRYFVPLMRALGERHRVWAPDQPGFGGSGRPQPPLDVAALGRALADWMHVAQVGPAVVVANSLGCQVALAMVEQLPEPAVERLLLLGPTMDPAAPTPIRQALRLTADVPREKPALWAIAFRDYVWAGPWRCWTTLRLALADDPLARIARVNRPTLVVRGSRDPIVSSAWAQRLAAAAPAGRYEEIAGAPHAAHMAMPVQVADLITRFALSMPG